MSGHRHTDSVLSRLYGAASPYRSVVAMLVCALAAVLLCSAPAGADVFGPIALVSAGRLQQAEYAHDPAISGNGKYVVFDGSVGGVTGIWRRETQPGGALVQVAGGDAVLPSISENGQYVSFTTNEGRALPEITDEQPDLREAHEPPNVYVRDMAIAPAAPCQPGEPCAFTLASAASGPRGALPAPLTYEYPVGESRSVEEENFGSAAAGRSAISADGDKVAFVTTAESDLAGPHTPKLQVAVRNLETNTTELVSVRYDPATGAPWIDPATGRPEPVAPEMEGAPIGAVYTPGGHPPFYGASQAYEETHEIGASISADGSTVAWMGQDVDEQVPTLAGERLRAEYSEPLWRRIADGPYAPTRAITGGADPLAPQCLASHEHALGEPATDADPCQGPFKTEAGSEGIWSGSAGEAIPRLSADGLEVAFLATAPLLSLGADFGIEMIGRNSDLYVADMHEGLTRNQALHPLTELANANEASIATNGPITAFGVSANGEQVAFTTERTAFPLGSPAYVSVPAVVPGLAELYDVDLSQDTLTRVTHGYTEGELSAQPVTLGREEEDLYQNEPITDGALSPSFDESGELLAFSSAASNLVYGDGNTPAPGQANHGDDGSDAYVVNRVTFGSEPAAQFISSAPANPAVMPSWMLGVTALSSSNGSVRLYIQLPGAGRLSAQAFSAVKVPTMSREPRAARRARLTATVRTRTVASDGTGVQEAEGGLTTLLLIPAARYSPLVQAGGLSATAELTFTAPSHPVIHQSIAVTFLRSPKAGASRRSHLAEARARAHRSEHR
jgi:hypothetical protein